MLLVLLDYITLLFLNLEIGWASMHKNMSEELEVVQLWNTYSKNKNLPLLQLEPMP